MRKKNREPMRFPARRHFPVEQREENVLKEEEEEEEKQPPENQEQDEEIEPFNGDVDLELTLNGGFPVDPSPPPPPQPPNSTGHQNQNDGLDLRLGALLPPPENLNHQSLIDAIGRDNSINCLIRCTRAAYGTIALLNRSFRELIKSGEIYKIRYDNNIIEHWVYFSCNLNQWEAFDPSNNKWIELPMMHADQCFQFSDKESMAVGTELLVLGRGLTGHVIHKYSLLTNSWSIAKAMNHPRCLFGSACVGLAAIFAGGVNRNGEILDTVELYDSRSGNWVVLPNMNKPRRMSSGVYMDGKFYAIGGVGVDMKSLSCGEEYDLETKKWRLIPNMSPVDTRGGMAPPLVAVVGNELYAADSDNMALKRWVKKKKVWETIGRLPERAHSMDGWGMAFRGCGERVVVVGGPRRHGGGEVEVYSWVPSEGPPEWSMIGQKSSDSFVYNCAIMGC